MKAAKVPPYMQVIVSILENIKDKKISGRLEWFKLNKLKFICCYNCISQLVNRNEMPKVVNPSFLGSVLRQKQPWETQPGPKGVLTEHCRKPGSSSPEVTSLPWTYARFPWANFVDVCLLNQSSPKYTNCCTVLKQNQFGTDESLHAALPRQSDSLLIFFLSFWFLFFFPPMKFHFLAVATFQSCVVCSGASLFFRHIKVDLFGGWVCWRCWV